MSVDPAPKVLIQNKLAKCRSKLQELSPLINAKRMCSNSYAGAHTDVIHSGQEVDKYTKLVVAYTGDRSLGDIDDLTNVGCVMTLAVEHNHSYQLSTAELFGVQTTIGLLVVFRTCLEC